jgi:hypothetical protein
MNLNLPDRAPRERAEAEIEARIKALFGRCPALNRFSVRDRSQLPDHVNPVALQGEIFIFEVSLSPRYGNRQYEEIYGQIAATLHDAIKAQPEARALLPGRSFVRALH